MNMGDTVFMFVTTVMVMLMTPGLALFYGGMVRSKNVLSTTMHSYSAMAIVSIQWIVIGYSLSFGPDWHGLIGTLDWFGLNGVTYAPNPDYSSTIPHNLFMMFQLMFAILTPALISGAFAERMRFSAFLIFILFMDNDCLQSCRSLGMGRRRVAKGTWCTRLRWRKRRSHHFRSCWSCISYFPRKTKKHKWFFLLTICHLQC